ncbi:cobalamin-binding protein [bacterium]|nr:cobalamin-binding protein [bacterium]
MTTQKNFRIISLVPSLTETLCHFGLEQNLVGCTSFCIEPMSLRKRVISVGGTKDPRIEDILLLKPTHVLTNNEENTSDLIHTLKTLSATHHFEVIETFLEKPADNFQLVERLSKTFEFGSAAKEWVNDRQSEFNQLQSDLKNSGQFSFMYFIWMNPWMVAGNQTYISNTLALVGGKNVIVTGMQLTERYPPIEINDPRIVKSDLLLFSSEPFPFKKRHVEEFFQKCGKKQPYLLVDGQALSWYGSRFASTLLYLRKLYEEIQKI